MNARATGLLAAVLLSIPSILPAAPFDPLSVSADAKFVAFFDLEAGRKTALGGWAMQRLQEDPKYQQFEQTMINAAGFMPATDITDVTIYGDKYADEPDATLLIRGVFDSNKLANALTFAQGFKSDVYNKHTIMSWIDEEKDRPVHACIIDDKTIVMTSNVERLMSSIDVLDDSTKAMKDDSPLPRPTHKDAWAFAVGADLQSSPAVIKNDALNGVLDRGVFEIAEEGGRSSLILTLQTQTPEQAQQALNAANGLKALVQMAANRRPPVPERAKLGADLAKATTVQAAGNTVSLVLALENEEAKDLLERAAALRD